MSRSLQDLAPETRLKALETLRLADSLGVDLLVTCTYRSPQEQARIYRRSRTRAEIEAKARALEKRGYPLLREILLEVGPQHGALGAHATWAAPGESYHLFGRAFDVVPLLNGKPTWDDHAPGWAIFGVCCQQAGLEWAGTWPAAHELPHAQLPGPSNPLDLFSAEQVTAELRHRQDTR
jgi:peptidoglycan LD-endopeptidase CwlK